MTIPRSFLEPAVVRELFDVCGACGDVGAVCMQCGQALDDCDCGADQCPVACACAYADPVGVFDV